MLDTGIRPTPMSDPPTWELYSHPSEHIAWWHSVEKPRMLAQGIIRVVPPAEQRHVIHAFIIPKATPGKYQLIIDYRPVNAFFPNLPVQYEDIR